MFDSLQNKTPFEVALSNAQETFGTLKIKLDSGDLKPLVQRGEGASHHDRVKINTCLKLCQEHLLEDRSKRFTTTDLVSEDRVTPADATVPQAT